VLKTLGPSWSSRYFHSLTRALARSASCNTLSCRASQVPTLFGLLEQSRAVDWFHSHQTEWWYYTGNLETVEGRYFGYQLTFFRRGLGPLAERQERASGWAADQVYMAHFSVTDVAGERYQAFERLSRGAAGLAGTESVPYRVWLEDWRAEEVKPNGASLLRPALTMRQYESAVHNFGTDMLCQPQRQSMDARKRRSAQSVCPTFHG
jgi:predicted secreted hydrolase